MNIAKTIIVSAALAVAVAIPLTATLAQAASKQSDMQRQLDSLKVKLRYNNTDNLKLKDLLDSEKNKNKNLQKEKQELKKRLQAKRKLPKGKAGVIMSTLSSIGVTHRAAAFLIGSWQQESGLVPCGKWGDGGLAHGLNQWHPGRRHDMPCDLKNQVKWAINTEMARDTPWATKVIRDPLASDYQIKNAIERWTRWGHEGNRWQLALAYL